MRKTLKHMNKRPLKLQSCPLHSLHTSSCIFQLVLCCVVQCVHPLFRSKGFVMGTDEAKQRLKAGKPPLSDNGTQKTKFLLKAT